MAQYQWQHADLITAARLNSNSYNLFKGVAGYEDTVILADNVNGTFLIKPNVDPVASTQLFQMQNAAGALMFTILADGTFVSSGSPAIVKFDEEILAAPAATVTLTVSAIVYKSLRLVGYAAVDTPISSAVQFLGIQFNGDATLGHYNAGFTEATSGTVTATSEANRAEMLLGYLPATADLANGFGAYVFDIPYYNNVANHKSLIGQWGYQSGNATDFVGVKQGQAMGTWASTAAITSVTISNASGGGNFVAGTIWTLLGVP